MLSLLPPRVVRFRRDAVLHLAVALELATTLEFPHLVRMREEGLLCRGIGPAVAEWWLASATWHHGLLLMCIIPGANLIMG